MSATRLDRVLVVEDDRDIQVIVRFALEDIGGFTLAVCDSGLSAIAAAPMFAPALVLLDVTMPQMDGPQTLQALRALPSCAHVPIVFMTANVQPDAISSLHALGAAAVIVKPFDPLTLAALVQQIWAAHSHSDSSPHVAAVLPQAPIEHPFKICKMNSRCWCGSSAVLVAAQFDRVVSLRKQRGWDQRDIPVQHALRHSSGPVHI